MTQQDPLSFHELKDINTRSIQWILVITASVTLMLSFALAAFLFHSKTQWHPESQRIPFFVSPPGPLLQINPTQERKEHQQREKEALKSSGIDSQLNSVSFEQKLNESIPQDLIFLDDTGNPIQLKDFFRDKPVLLTFAYYSCPNLCSLVLNGLTQALQKMPLTPGQDFELLTLSINPLESLSRATTKKRSYLTRLGNQNAQWHFLRGDPISIARLTQAVGFHYSYDVVSRQYSHPSGAVIITPQGKISRYFFGIQFEPNDLKASLSSAKQGKMGQIIETLLLYCLHYNPEMSKIGQNAMLIVRMAAILTLLIIIFMITHLKKKEGMLK